MSAWVLHGSALLVQSLHDGYFNGSSLLVYMGFYPHVIRQAILNREEDSPCSLQNALLWLAFPVPTVTQAMPRATQKRSPVRLAVADMLRRVQTALM